MQKNEDQHTDQSALIAALRGTTRRLDNENAIMRHALETLALDAAIAVQQANALDLYDATIGTLDTILEHASHAWRALEAAGLAENNPDGAWPPQTNQPHGSVAYHLAIMIQYTKKLCDGLQAETG